MPKRVLLVDYEPHSVERVRGVLREPDYEIVPARDGEEALNTFSSSRFDLVLLSGMLPRLPSAEVIREIRRRGGPTAPPILLMVSGYRGSNAKADAQRVGAFDLLSRPFSDETLRQTAAGAIAATQTAGRGAGGGEPLSSLTSSDIFSEILQEVAREAQAAPVVRAPSAGTEAEVEKRLRDTLSGVLPKAPPAGETTPARRSTEAEVERLLSQTLSGLRTPRPRPPAPPPAPAARPEETAAVPAAGPDRFGQYEILERIASGGMAELFRARRRGVEGFEKIVAIKKILPHISGDEEFITMFADEAKLAAQLNHPNIVHIFDLGKVEDGGYFIAMEHVEGRDLRSILHLSRETNQRMPIPLAVAIAAKVAAALDYAHRRRGDDGSDLHIVHRDVSPPNILVSSDGDVKLCDFGIAKAASKVSRTESGALKGKVPYMSPEQAWGRAVDRRSDIYSLGSVLFELVTGRKLFQGDSDLNVLEKVRAGEVVPPSSLNPEVWPALDSVVLKALAVKPEDRYAEASDMLRDLEAVLRTYEPLPTSADLAVFVRSLETEAAALREERLRAAQQPAPPAPTEPESAEKGAEKRAVPPQEPAAAGSTPSPGPEEPPAPVIPSEAPAAPALFAASFPEKVHEGEGRNRSRLYALIAAAAVVLAGVVWFAVRKPGGGAVPVAPTPVPAAPATVAPAPPTAAPAPPDSKAIQEEAQRQIAAKRKEMQKSAEAAAKPTRSAEVRKPTPLPVRPAAAPAPPEPTPEVKTAEVQPVRAEPTAIPTPVEAAPTAAAAVRPPPPQPAESAPALARGDLVGPGPGVVEPVLASSLRIAYPPAARGTGGKVVVLVLVNEEGTVSEARLEQGIGSRPVNDAVLGAVRRAKFRPATKNQIPVKMWRTIVVDVKP